MGRPSRYSPEVREWAVRMVFEHQREYDSLDAVASVLNSRPRKTHRMEDTCRSP